MGREGPTKLSDEELERKVAWPIMFEKLWGNLWLHIYNCCSFESLPSCPLHCMYKYRKFIFVNQNPTTSLGLQLPTSLSNVDKKLAQLCERQWKRKEVSSSTSNWETEEDLLIFSNFQQTQSSYFLLHSVPIYIYTTESQVHLNLVFWEINPSK